MKIPTRILVTALVASLAFPAAGFAAKADRKKKDKNDAGAPAFSSLDKNNDGFVSQAEFLAAMKDKGGSEDALKSRFASMDKDSDSKLSKEEFETAGKGKKERRKKNKE